MRHIEKVLFPILLLLSVIPLYAQQETERDSLVRLIEAKAASLEDTNGVQYRKVIGPARFLHNDTYLLCDTALWEVKSNIIHAIGHVQIIQENTFLTSDKIDYFVEQDLAIPVVAGRKTESEKFAGAQDTYTIEALMHDGQALQSATSHFFGNAFPDAFNIKYADKNNELHSVYETSWGLSTRIIGAIIMVHGDDSGLVLPPRIAPVQTRVIPIAQHKEGVLDKANELLETLKAAGYRVKIDDSEKSPGWKFSEQEMLGIPTRIEIGPKDIENGQVVVVRRDTREKIVVSMDEIATKLGEILETVQKDLYAKAKAFLDDHISTATTIDEMKDAVQNKKGFVKAMWCGEEACEDEIKAQAGGVTSRCIPMEEEHLSDVCVCCGKPAKHMVYWGRAY